MAPFGNQRADEQRAEITNSLEPVRNAPLVPKIEVITIDDDDEDNICLSPMPPVRENRPVVVPEMSTTQRDRNRETSDDEDRSAPKKRRKINHVIDPSFIRVTRSKSMLNVEEDVIQHPPLKRNIYGEVPGCTVGTRVATRMEFCRMGVHRSPRAGFHGTPDDGCYSVLLLDDFDNNLDGGDSLIYKISSVPNVNKKKRDPKIRNRFFNMNAVFRASENTRLPVRVIRGSKQKGFFAPKYGYRYDGLYFVEKHCSVSDPDGYLIRYYKLNRLVSEPRAPWLSGNAK